MSESRERYEINGPLTTDQVAERAGISARSVLYHIQTGHLPAEKRARRWAILPDDAAFFVARLKAGEIGQRGGNFGGGRPPAENRMEREKDFTHIYIPTSAQERQRIADIVPTDRRLLVLEFAAYAESIAAADGRARKALDWWYSLSNEDKLSGIKEDWSFSPDWDPPEGWLDGLEES